MKEDSASGLLGKIRDYMARARGKSLTRNHRIEIVFENEPPVARVNASFIAEVLYSLIDNAAKYSPAGSLIKIFAGRAENAMIMIAIVRVESRVGADGAIPIGDKEIDKCQLDWKPDEYIETISGGANSRATNHGPANFDR